MGNSDTKAAEWNTGLRVIKMKQGSPAEQADFIVDVLPETSGFDLARDFTGFVAKNEEKEIKLLVINCFTGESRAVKITPSRKWTQADSLLGLKLRLETISNALNGVCRVTKVFQGSPAADSGIIEDRDYMIGCQQFEFRSVEEFSEKMSVLFDIEADPSLDLFMVDIGTLQGRYVRVKPTNLWKGDGLLGLEFGAGVFDSRTLRELLERGAKEAKKPLIPMNTNGTQHLSSAHQSNDLSNSTSQLVSSNRTHKSNLGNENPQDEGNTIAARQPSTVDSSYFDVVDDKIGKYSVKVSSLLPALQFPLRQFVYKA